MIKKADIRFLGLLLCFAMVLGCFTFASFAADETTSGSCGENLTWTLEGGVLTISGTGDMASYTWGDHAPWYEERESITSVVVQEGVTSIGGYAFNECSSLTSLTLPEGVTSLGWFATSGCRSLTSLTLPNSLTSIGRGVFFSTVNLSTVTIPETNAYFCTIDGVLFSKDCTTLLFVPRTLSGSYVVPETVASIGEYAFAWCDELTDITLPKGLTSIGNVAFECCNSLKSITIPEGITSIPFAAFNFCFNLTSITIPEGVVSIGDTAFQYCANLTGITFPESVVSIGESAFFACSSLTTVHYGGTQAQWDAITIASGNECLTNAQLVLTLHGTCGENLTWTLDGGVLTISGTGDMANYTWGDYAPWYEEREKITTVVLQEGVTSIGDCAFNGCRSLSSITIPEGVASIGDAAFEYCANLTGITFPESVVSIGSSAFFACSSLTSVNIPAGVTNIGTGAFASCSQLTGFTVSEKNACFCAVDGVLFSKDCTTIVEFPSAKSGSYSIPEGVTSIGDCAFIFCTGLTEITIPEGITSIGFGAFRMSSLTSITIPETVTSIGDFAFYACNNLKNVYYGGTQAQWDAITIGDRNECLTNAQLVTVLSGTCGENLTWTLESGVLTISGTGDMASYTWGDYAPWYEEREKITTVVLQEGVTSIGDCAFNGCRSLSSITIPEGVASIGDGAFNDCRSLSSITIPEGVASIGDGAFEYCANLTGITFPESVVSIGTSAFFACSSLTSVNIPAGVTNIGAGAFADCSQLTGFTVSEKNACFCAVDGVLFSKDCTTIVEFPSAKSGSYSIPEEVTSIGDCAFVFCTGLTEITIPEGITSIGFGAFQMCRSLTEVTIPEGVTSIGSSAFNGCVNLGSVTIPQSVTQIDFAAFSNCSSLTSISIPEGVTSIGMRTFYGCSSLTSITIPETVTSIGDSAFYACDSLKTVYYGGTQAQWDAITIGSGNECLTNAQLVLALRGTCGENLTWELVDGVLTISGTGEMAGFVPQYVECSAPWKDHASEIVKVVISEGVTNVATHTFTYCTNLTSVTLPSTITSIDPNAFWGCSSLTEIQIPVSVKSIIFGAFYNTGLEIVHYDGTREQWDEINIGNMNECLTNATIVYGDPSARMKLSLPKGTVTVENAAFQNCVTLESVLIPESVTGIAALAFDGCSSLKAITFSGSAPAIAADAFANVTATVYYPVGDLSWTAAIQQNYGGTLTWAAYAVK